jgi:uncharacterized iron-regulated membrane protein
MLPIFRKLHLWIGLACSLIVSILCLTGTILALYGPVEAWINRDVQRVTPTGERLPLEVLIPKLTSTGHYTSLTLPADPAASLQLRQGRDVTYVNPYTGAVLGDPDPRPRQVYLWTMRLHRWLLLDDGIGRKITGVATLGFLVTLFSGLFLWWPSKLLRVKRKARGRALNYQLHAVLGFYALVPLLVMGVTALNWSYRAPFKATVYRVLDGTSVPSPPPDTPDAKTSLTRLPYARLLAETDRVYPSPGTLRLFFPADATRPVEVMKVYAPLPTADELELDARSGAVIGRKPFSERTRAQQLLALVKDLHTGTIFGGWSLTLYVLACLIGTALPITGTLHWWFKLKRKLPRLPDQGRAEQRVRVLRHEGEAGGLVDAAGGDEDVVGPEGDALVAGLASEGDTLVHQPAAQAQAARGGLDVE